MRKLALILLVASATGCYHSTIDTGLAPSGQSIEKPWANSFVYGLVPPPVVETAAKCPSGVAKVETQQTFLNGLVNALTFGIYTPMTISVQCAAPRTGDASLIRDSDIARGLARAADRAVETKGEVFVVTR